MRSQPRIPGKPRVQTHTALLPVIEKRIADTADRFDVSKSWVRAVALAQYFGIDTAHYDHMVERRRSLRVVRGGKRAAK